MIMWNEELGDAGGLARLNRDRGVSKSPLVEVIHEERRLTGKAAYRTLYKETHVDYWRLSGVT